MTEKKQYLFGPVPSRRLGRSLGLDIVPLKLCSLDCIYCQIGRTTVSTLQRKEYVPIEDVLTQLKEKLAQGLTADYITISGSGEPTLNSRLGELIDQIKTLTDIPVAVITNATLFSDPQVRTDCARADLVLPSLDAGDEKTFKKINRPSANLQIEKIIDGLIHFRAEYSGPIWLEVFLIDSVNTDNASIAAIKQAIDRIAPDKVQLNTAIRPTAEPGIKMIDPERLKQIVTLFSPNCETIAVFSTAQAPNHTRTSPEQILAMLKRRPCSINDISNGLSLIPSHVENHLAELTRQGLITSEQRPTGIFYSALK